MKDIYKIFYVLFFLIIFYLPVNAETLTGEINFTWDKISQTERENDIENIRLTIFDNNVVYKYDKNIFKDTYENLRKDENYKENFLSVKAGLQNTNDKIIVPFYFKKLLLGYGIIYKSDLTHCYYYNALGRLFVVEIFNDDYGNYPNISYQYDTRGNLIGGIYSENKYDDYMYDNKGNFEGRWYKKNCYNANGKIIMTRTLPY